MKAQTVSSMRWVSFHIFLPEPLEPFLVRFLLPALEAPEAQGWFRRFFFIRYGQPALHLRLRFLPAPGDERLVGEHLRACVERYRRDLGPAQQEIRLEQQPYDRATHYFGETPGSVYAELLNEGTSWLALRLLRQLAGASLARRLLSVASVLAQLVRSSADPRELSCILAASEAFARGVASEHGFAIDLPDRDAETVLVRALAQALHRNQAGLASDPAVRRVARLLQRARRASRGEQVATHALHLFCNKSGLTIREERNAFWLLQKTLLLDGGSQTGENRRIS